MSKFYVTIAREFASGGSLIGRRLAEALGAAFYDKELISLTAKETGFTESAVAEAEQSRTRSLLYSLSMSASGPAELPINDQIYIAQSRVIQNLAKQGSCVIVGRAADYALRDEPGGFNVFIHAPLSERVRRAREEYGIEEKNMEVFVRREDKKRASFYEYNSQQKWGLAANYHLCLNSTIGIGNAVSVLVSLVRGAEVSNA